MINEKMDQALNEIRDEYIENAAKLKRKPHLAWLPAVAALLALAILAGALLSPWTPPSLETPTTNGPSLFPSSSQVLSQPSSDPSATKASEYPVPPELPPCIIRLSNYSNHQTTYAPELASQLQAFFDQSIRATLGKDTGINKAYSPANLYLAMSLLAELSNGNTQIMGLLGAENLDALRTSANRLWNSTYYDVQDHVSLSNSLWLDQDLQYDINIMEALAEHYFTDSFYGDLGTQEVNQQIASWIDQRTGNLLQEQTKQIALPEDIVFALYSTLYFKVQWKKQFRENQNIQGTFYGNTQSTVTFMRKTETTQFYRGSNFTAICSGLKTGGMWLILPDQGITPEELLESQEYLNLVLGKDRPSYPAVQVNVTLPKFDIQTTSSLQGDLQSLGISDIFDPEKNSLGSFLKSTIDGPVYISEINQATRVCVDEIGVTAANYVEIQAPGSSGPPGVTVDFTLDRPFLFVITSSYDLPLFAGIVNDLS